MYKLINDEFGNPINFILRLTDNAYIPMEPSGIDYQEYLCWLSQGNTPLPADAEL